jgi:hypothetical protein
MPYALSMSLIVNVANLVFIDRIKKFGLSWLKEILVIELTIGFSCIKLLKGKRGSDAQIARENKSY